MDTSSSPLVSIMIFHHKYSLKHLFGFIYHFTSWIIAKVTDVNYMLSKLCCLYVSILYHMVIQFLNNFLKYIFRLSPFYLPLYCGWNYYAKPPDKYQNFFRLSRKHPTENSSIVKYFISIQNVCGISIDLKKHLFFLNYFLKYSPFKSILENTNYTHSPWRLIVWRKRNDLFAYFFCIKQITNGYPNYVHCHCIKRINMSEFPFIAILRKYRLHP